MVLRDEVLEYKVPCSPMKFPVILGLPWLKKHDPVIDWKNLALGFHKTLKLDMAKSLQATVTPIQDQDSSTLQIKEFDQNISDVSSLIWITPLSSNSDKEYIGP